MLIFLVLLLIAYIAREVFFGYPAPASPMTMLSSKEHAFVLMSGRTLVPPGPGPLPSVEEADVTGHVDRYLAVMPPLQRRLVRALFFLMEHGTYFLLPAARRFSALSAADREAYLLGWEQSPLYFRRIAFASLRAVLTMAYLGHPGVERALHISRHPATSGDLALARRDGSIADPVSGQVTDPYAGIVEYPHYDHDLSLTADVVVVGSGPGGAPIAKELAEAGLQVIVLEEGPVFRPRDFVTDGAHSLARICREGGLRVCHGNLILPTMQAAALGGTSLINSAICNRAPASALSQWRDHHDLPEISREALDPHYDRVARIINVVPAAEGILGRRNQLFRQGCDRLGISSEPMPRAERGCAGTGECFTGCTQRAKQSLDISYIPLAVRAGARVYTSVRVERVLLDGHRAVGVTGQVVAPFTGKPSGRTVTVRARCTVLATGVMATPVLLRKSGVPDPSGQIGRNLQHHPGASLVGLFPDPVDPWLGATQGYQSLEYLPRGFKMETLWAPPPVLAVRFPGFGQRYKDLLQRYRFMAPWNIIQKGTYSRGTVMPRQKGPRPVIRYDLDPRDFVQIQEGLVELAEVFFAAGAEAVMSGARGLPEWLRREDRSLLRRADLSPRDFTFASNHVFGTCRMGKSERTGVVDASGKVHGLDDLYISDTSIMPETTAVNPMFTCLALSDRIAGILKDRYPARAG